MMRKIILSGAAALLVLCSCQEKRTIYRNDQDVNKWIYNRVAENYLWSASLRDIEGTDRNLDPDKYFDEYLRYRSNTSSDYRDDRFGDRFSRVSKSSASTRSGLHAADETKNDFGFLYAQVVLPNDQNTVRQGVILSVVPGSPADKAGLKRGDCFNMVNEKALPTDAYTFYQLINSNSVSLNVIYPETKTVRINKATYDNNPVIFDTIYTEIENRTGYLVYNHFTRGTNNKFNDALKEVMGRFKSAGVTHVIVDMRYNGGGELSAATQLASMLAPARLLGQPFVYLERNGSFGNPSLFEESPFLAADAIGDANLDPSNIYFITSENTASASELLIHGFKAYDDYLGVYHTGSTTVGKNVGGVNISNSSYEWEIDLITIRIYDRYKVSGYERGLVPETSAVEHYAIPWYQNNLETLTVVGDFGKPQKDPLLEAVYRVVAGYSPTPQSWEAGQERLPAGEVLVNIPDLGIIDDLSL